MRSDQQDACVNAGRNTVFSLWSRWSLLRMLKYGQQNRGYDSERGAPCEFRKRQPYPRAQGLSAMPRRFAPAGVCTGAFASVTILSCSALCASAYPSAGLARSGRPM